LESQGQPQQPDLERGFKRQEAEEKKRKEKMREEREREAVESNVIIGDRYSGFNY
jgi:hypothetical protein